MFRNYSFLFIIFKIDWCYLCYLYNVFFYEFILVLAGLLEKCNIFKQLSRIVWFCIKYCMFFSRRSYFQIYKSFVQILEFYCLNAYSWREDVKVGIFIHRNFVGSSNNERQHKCLESISDIYAVYIVRTLFSFVIVIQ